MFEKLALLVAISMLLLSTACTERTLEIGFLSISRESTEFKVTNETNDGVILGDDEGQLPLNIVCSKNVTSIEINLGNGFENIQTLNSGSGSVSCSTTGTANVLISAAGLVSTTTQVQGARIVPGTLRWTTTDPDDATSTLIYSKVIAAKFAPPSLNVNSMAAMNIANASLYSVTGTCTGILQYEASFNSLSFSPQCDHGTLYMAINTSSIADGTVNASIKHYGVMGNYSMYSQVLQKDTVKPAVTLVGKGWSTQNGVSIYQVDAQFSEAVTDFSLGAIDINNGTASVLTGALDLYSFYVQPTGNGDLTVRVLADQAKDVVGNLNIPSADLVISYSTTQPTVTLSSSAPEPLNTSFYVTAVFSEAVTGFTLSDVAVSAGTVSDFTGSAANYQFKVTPTTNGAVEVSVPANVAQSASLNGNLASQSLLRTYDSVAPTVVLSTPSTSGSVWNFNATFSESVTGFVASDVTVTNGAVTSFSGTGAVYTFQVTPAGFGTVSVNIPAQGAFDAAGNGNIAAMFTSDYNPPPPTITSFSPTSGPAGGGTVLTINGSNLLTSSVVSINGVGCGNVTHFGNTQITCVTSAGTVGAYPIAVNTDQGATVSTGTFSYSSTEYASVDAGAFHTCGLMNNGVARCWGQNNSGELGTGLTTGSNKPIAVAGGLRFTKIAVGTNFTCALTQAGGVYCWGYNASYQLGDGTSADRTVPTAISSGVQFKTVETGGSHACAISISDVLYCWGANNYNQVGVSGSSTITVPTVVDSGVGYKKVALGFDHTCAVTSSDTVKCWGNNASGQLGSGDFLTKTLPTFLSDGGSYTSITAGNAFTCGVTTSGTVKCWGTNASGQIGVGAVGGTYSSPQSVSGLSAVTALSAGVSSVCALKNTNSLLCWGANASGQLGDGTTTTRSTPTNTVEFLSGPTVGGDFACGLTAAAGIKCWGGNASGQLGNGSTSSSSTAVAAQD